MEIIEKQVPLNFNLFLVGDQHIGSIMSHRSGWLKMCDMVNSTYEGIKSHNNFVIDHGDMCEAISIDDPRYDMQVTTAEGSQLFRQRKQAIADREPIKDNLITILKGNHEHKVIRHGNLTKEVCEKLNVPYGTVSCVIEYWNRNRLLFKHYTHHGFGTIKSIAHPTIRRETNRKISLMQKFDSKFGDCLINSMGHTHQLIVCQPESKLYMTTDNRKIKQKYTEPKKVTGYIEPNHRWYVNTGSFLKTYGMGIDSYGERFGYDPVELGFVVILVRDGKIAPKNVRRIRLD